MFRLGDRWLWARSTGAQIGDPGSYSALVTDYNKNGTSYGDAVHPDLAGRWAGRVRQRDPDANAAGFYITSMWYQGPPEEVDLNFGMADGSVLRVNAAHTLRFRDWGLAQVPSFRDARYGHLTAVPTY